MYAVICMDYSRLMKNYPLLKFLVEYGDVPFTWGDCNYSLISPKKLLDYLEQIAEAEDELKELDIFKIDVELLGRNVPNNEFYINMEK